jgi:hypothetical protein
MVACTPSVMLSIAARPFGSSRPSSSGAAANAASTPKSAGGRITIARATFDGRLTTARFGPIRS